MRANVNSYTLGAEVENLTFVGTGNFTGTGNAGANTITGGAGADTLRGGGGADVFVMVKGDANGDLIADFTRSQGDTITFSGYAAGSILAGRTVAAGTTTYLVQNAGATVDTIKLTGNITLTAGTDYKFV